MNINPQRAEQVHQIFQQGVKGLALRLWPNLKYVTVCKTGSFEHSAKKLREGFLKGLPQVYGIHAGTEGFFGNNLTTDVEGEVLTFMPHVSFLEFIPEDKMEEDNPKTLFMDEVSQNYGSLLDNVGYAGPGLRVEWQTITTVGHAR